MARTPVGRGRASTSVMPPNFLIIGAARCGTSTLYGYLQEHPDIYLPANKRPEPHFFFKTSEYAQGFAYYEARYFTDHSGQRAVGEASTSYLFGARTPARVADHLPDARFIAMLRNPLQRAFSNYWHTLKSGLETLSFSAAIEQEQQRGATEDDPVLAEVQPYAYLARGLYGEQLKRWYGHFEPQQVHVILFEDFVRDPGKALRDTLAFLQVDASVLPADLDRADNRSTPKGAFFSQEDRRMMQEFFADDVALLESLLSRDLSSWLK